MKSTTSRVIAYLFPMMNKFNATDGLRDILEREIGKLLQRGNRFTVSMSDGRVLKINVKVL